MTRGEALKDFFRKTILPVASAALLYCIFRSACVKNGELDYLWLWILCGLPFGIWRLRLWIIPGGGKVAGDARRAIEADTGRPAVTAENAAQLNAVVTDVIQGVAEADKPNEDEK